jgi:hypothetical protein
VVEAVIRRPADRSRLGRTAWGTHALVLGVVLVGAWLVALRRDVLASGFAHVETARARLDAGPGWVDERWSDELRWLLAEIPPPSIEDRASLDDLGRRVAGLSFVASVDDVAVLWPDGLCVALTMREPVACIHVGRDFMTVAEDGTLLSGRWPTPPARDGGFLPVLRLDDERELRGSRRPGARLREPAALDALAVAASLWRDLSPGGQARLGRSVIDARRARLATVEEPGTRILLEGERTVLFGRSPNLGEPGELPLEAKWAHVEAALRLLEPDPQRAEAPQGLDWEVLDARWDRADLQPRVAPDAPDAPR